MRTHADFVGNGAVVHDGGVLAAAVAGNVAHVGRRDGVRSDGQREDADVGRAAVVAHAFQLLFGELGAAVADQHHRLMAARTGAPRRLELNQPFLFLSDQVQLGQITFAEVR